MSLPCLPVEVPDFGPTEALGAPVSSDYSKEQCLSQYLEVLTSAWQVSPTLLRTNFRQSCNNISNESLLCVGRECGPDIQAQ